MLTKITIRNFKRFGNVEIELGNPVVFIGPNNSGKTTALQALALWEIGLRRWKEKKGAKPVSKERTGVAINRKDLVSVPVPNANLLWKELHTRDVRTIDGKQQTKNVRIEILVEGVTGDKSWKCGIEFDYFNEESFYCRPLRDKNNVPMPIPQEAEKIRIAYLPPMSGLAAEEPKWERGRINVLIGEARTAEVLRNLCWQIGDSDEDVWKKVSTYIRDLFGVELNKPEFIAERGEIRMTYRESQKVSLDISSAGRGLHQTLLLLAYLYQNENSVLLLDEPDAHLEILRQRQIYQILTDVATKQNSQIIAASHSEVVLNEAAGRDLVIAFLGKPHRIDDRGSQLLKSLREIGYDQYYQAEQTGWVLYLEGPTDLSILREFARRLNLPAANYLERPFVHYVLNQPQKARDHFYGLQEAKKDLVGIAIFDRIAAQLQTDQPLLEIMWRKRELENYLCHREVLLAYAKGEGNNDLFSAAESQKREQVMESCIEEITTSLSVLGKDNPWSGDIKATDEFLNPLFSLYFKKLKLPNLIQKTDYHQLVKFLPDNLIDKEIIEKLNAVDKVASSAKWQDR
jgi:hypothetical protein